MELKYVVMEGKMPRLNNMSMRELVDLLIKYGIMKKGDFAYFNEPLSDEEKAILTVSVRFPNDKFLFITLMYGVRLSVELLHNPEKYKDTMTNVVDREVTSQSLLGLFETMKVKEGWKDLVRKPAKFPFFNIKK